MRVRPARANEADFLTHLALRSKATWGYTPEFMSRCEAVLRVSSDYIRTHPIFVAERAATPLGFYSLNAARYGIELDLLFVEPRALRSGVGRVLLGHAVETAVSMGYATLFVESDPGAEAFYLGMGGVRIGTVPSTVEEDRELPLLRFDLPK